MSRKCSLHNLALEKGLRCDKGYIQVFLRHSGQLICKNFGPHTIDSQEVAGIFLAEKRKEVLQRKIGIEPELPSKKFKDVAILWFQFWQKERNPDGTEAHNKESCYKVLWTINRILIPSFGETNFHELRSVDIETWRRTYTDKGLSGVTANRYQAILSSIYSHVVKWSKTERIKERFKLPLENPCDVVELSPSIRRERILSKYEASKLKLAFTQLDDLDGWEICKMALKSVLSLKDLKGLQIGSEINTVRSKTGVPVQIPLTVVSKLNFYGWRTRWEKARKLAGLQDFEFRDLRKSGINWLKGSHDIKLISEYAGHSTVKTTERSYTVKQAETLRPLAVDLETQVDQI